MKKRIALFFLFIYLVNLTGQLAIHQFLVFQSDKFFNEQIGKNLYNVNDLTEVKVPISLPNVTDWKTFQNLKGSIRFENTSYNYVKIRVTKNAIYLMCVPNYETTHLFGENVIYAKQIPDIPVPKKEHVPFGKINSIVYSFQAIDYCFVTPLIKAVKVYCCNHSNAPNFNIAGPAQPPDSTYILS